LRAEHDREYHASQLICELSEQLGDAQPKLLSEIELARFDEQETQELLPLLWQYIREHRDSNSPDRLVSVGSAIRKYIAIMPMGSMGELSELLDPENRSPLPIELELEVVKMVYRNFEVHPPATTDSEPNLSERLWEVVQAYMNPRILSRDKIPAVTSLAIEALVAMRSSRAQDAWIMAMNSPFGWFKELVCDELINLHERWTTKSEEAAEWLVELRTQVLRSVQR